MIPGTESFSSPGHGDAARTGVLVVHGLTASPQSLGPLSRHLADLGYAVSAPLLPGHGTTWQDLARTRYADWLGALEGAAVDLRARVDRMVVVGLSLGGALTTELAATRPDLVDAIVLINPAFAADDPRLRLLPLLKHVLPTVEAIGNDVRHPGAEKELAYDRLPVKAFASFAQRWPHLLTLARQVRVPVLLLRSAHDRVVPARSSQVFLEHVGSDDVTEVVLPESGHVAALDRDAPLLLERTAEFVARVAVVVR
ncbi:alpha/beta hydrolase [Ornithinimicrobium sp. LYQ103]|uniref:alpha/beta hydrolase n=1 Tax=Ornithinimicrobium sp. LYQ103 TaxID=3378796 RepID=UPI00385248A5